MVKRQKFPYVDSISKRKARIISQTFYRISQVIIKQFAEFTSIYACRKAAILIVGGYVLFMTRLIPFIKLYKQRIVNLIKIEERRYIIAIRWQLFKTRVIL